VIDSYDLYGRYEIAHPNPNTWGGSTI
jgi:hypothetical protein